MNIQYVLNNLCDWRILGPKQISLVITMLMPVSQGPLLEYILRSSHLSLQVLRSALNARIESCLRWEMSSEGADLRSKLGRYPLSPETKVPTRY